MIKPIIPTKVKEAIAKTVVEVLEETKEVDMGKIVETLEKEYKIKFFNMEILQKLVKEELDNIVFIYC